LEERYELLQAEENDIRSHQTRSLGSKYTKNAFAARSLAFVEPRKRVWWLQMVYISC